MTVSNSINVDHQSQKHRLEGKSQQDNQACQGSRWHTFTLQAWWSMCFRPQVALWPLP